MTDNIIDIKSARSKKAVKTIYPDKNYIISGKLAVLLAQFASFICRHDSLINEDQKMQAVGYMATLTDGILAEKWEEVNVSE